MINELSASKALLGHLKAISGLPALAQESKPFTPTPNVPYLREQDYSGMTQAPTLAADESTKDGTFDGQAEKNGSTTRLYKSISGMELGQVFFMTNSLPYAQRLEQGWSAKSSNMVARAVNNFPAVLSEEVAKAK